MDWSRGPTAVPKQRFSALLEEPATLKQQRARISLNTILGFLAFTQRSASQQPTQSFWHGPSLAFPGFAGFGSLPDVLLLFAFNGSVATVKRLIVTETIEFCGVWYVGTLA